MKRPESGAGENLVPKRASPPGLDFPTLLSGRSLARSLALNPALAGQDRVLEICARLGATTYVNPPGGVEL